MRPRAGPRIALACFTAEVKRRRAGAAGNSLSCMSENGEWSAMKRA
jgi:hypothetical protein